MDTAPQRAMEDVVRLVLIMIVLTACHIHAGPPRQRRPFWHRHPRAELTVPQVVETPAVAAPATPAPDLP